MTVTEIAYAKRSTTLTGIASGGIFTAAPIAFDTGEEVVVPTLSRPCYLVGSAILVSEAPSTAETVELAIGQVSSVPIALNAVLNSSHGPALASGARQWCFARIDPFTPGRRYQLFAASTAGAITCLSPSHSHAFLWAYI